MHLEKPRSENLRSPRVLAFSLLASVLVVGSLAAQTLEQIHYRWRNDYGAEVGVPNGTMQVSGTSTIQTTSNTYRLIDKMAMSPGVAGDFLVFFTATTEATSTSTQRFSIFVDGVQVTHSEREVLTEESIHDTPFNVVTHAYLPGLAAGQVVSVHWLTTNGTVAMRGRTLTISQVNGADVMQATATSNTNTSSVTDTLVNGMTLTPGVAGDYLVWFSNSLRGNNDDVETWISLYHNGAQVPHTERRIDQEESLEGDTYFPAGTHTLLTGVAPGDSIEARWRTESSSTMLERALTLYRINPADAFQAIATLDDTTTSGTFSQVAGMTLVPGVGDYHVWFTSTLQGTDGDQEMDVALYVNGVQVPHTLRDFLVETSFEDTLQSQPVALHAFVTGVGAADVIDVRWREVGGGTATMHQRTLTAWRDTPGLPQAWWTAAEDTKLFGVPKNTTQRIRFEVSNEGGAASGPVNYQLRVSEGADCMGGVYTAVPTGSSGHWQVVDSIWITDGEATQNVSPGLTDEATGFVSGELKDATNATGTISLNPDEFTEIEFAIQATANAVFGQDYCFQLYDANSGTLLDNYSVYAEAQLEGGTLFLAEHDAGQQPDKFTTTSPVTSELFGFKLSSIGTVTIDQLEVRFSTGGGVSSGDVTSGQLYLDVNDDGIIDGGDILIQGGVSGSSGRLTFTTNFTPAVSGSNYLVRATVSGLVGGDTTTFTLSTTDIDETTSPISESGSVSGATHTMDPTLTLANHSGGQVTDQFTTITPITTHVFGFRLTRGGSVTVDAVRLAFTTGGGVVNGDVTSAELWRDDNNDGVIGGGDTSIQTGVTPVGGLLTFTSNFQPSSFGTNYLVRVTVANLVTNDTTTFLGLGTADIDVLEAGVVEAGSTSGATHTQDATLILSDHDVGQTADKFVSTSPVTDVLFGFKLASGTVTVDALRVNFTTGLGVSNGDVTAGELWTDVNDDGVIDGGDTFVEVGVTPIGGVLTFTSDFVPASGTNYLVRATVANLTGGDTTTFSVGPSDIDEVEVGVVESGSITSATHTHDGTASPKDVYYSVGTSGADLKTGSPTITINAGTATLSVAQTGNVGVGDVIAFGGTQVHIHQVTSQTELEVRAADGTMPANTGATLVSSIGRTFNSWQNAVNQSGTGAFLGSFDLTAVDARVTWVGYDDGPFNGQVDVDGYTTDWTRYLRLSVAGPSQIASGLTQRHDGTAGSGTVIRPQTNGVAALRIRDSFTRVEWLELDGSGRGPASDNVGVHVDAAGDNALVQGLLIHHEASGDQTAHGILINGNATEVRNCFIYEVDDGVETFGTGVTLKSLTIYAANDDGVEVAGGTASAENVIAMAAGIDFFENGGTFSLVDNCMSDNGSADDFGGTGNLVFMPAVDQFVSITPGSEDLHLKTGADALDAGKDLSATFNFDIDGGVRQTPWDMGADDFAAVTAVELVRFDATPGDGAVALAWETASELDNLGFHLHRGATDDGPFERITQDVIPGLGSSPAGAEYHYVDTGLTNGTTYHYLLEDVETNGTTKTHGPVTVTPIAGATVPDESEREGEVPPVSPRITYGDPDENGLRILEQGTGGLVLELVTSGFYGVPQEDGSVAVEIPGFDGLADEGDGAAAIPVKHHWVEAVAGRKVELAAVRGHMEPVATAWALSEEAPELVAHENGTVEARRVRRARPASGAEGLFPAEAARLVTVAFQGDEKKALVELAPVRWDAGTGELYLIRRLVVRLSFRSVEPSEQSLGGARGRRRARRAGGTEDVLARLATAESGLYRVRYDELFGIEGIMSTAALRLTRQGEDVAFHVEPRGAPFRRGSILYFSSEGGSANPHGNEAVYELRLASPDYPGARMEVTEALPAGSGSEGGLLWSRLEREENLQYQPALLDAPDRWFWDLLLAPVTKSYTFEVVDLATTEESGLIDVWLQGASDTPASPDHHVLLFVNGAFLAEASWNGKSPRRVSAELPPGLLVEGDNRLELVNVGDTEATHSLVMLDRFAIEYPRNLLPEAGVLAGRFSEGGTVALGAEALALETSGPSPRWLIGSGQGSFAVQAGGTYLFVEPGAVRAPEIRRPDADSLRSLDNQADYLVIGPRDFVEAASPLLSHRAEQGLISLGVALEDVFAAFGHGEPRPEAIREFLAYAYHEWQAPSPRYVLLLGDGSYDYKDLSGLGVTNPVPPLMVKTSYLWTASDPALGAVNGEDLLPDVAVGRLPASSVAEVEALVSKILAFESRGDGLNGPAVLVADDPDHGGAFVADAEAAARRIPAGIEVTRIYLSELGADASRGRIVESFDRGASVVSYIGHGGIHLWADENLLDTERVGLLSEQDRQPLVLTMNCLNGYFHFPHFDSLAEELVKAENRGAIAAISPSGMSVNDRAQRFHRAMLDELFSGGHLRLGDALLGAQETYLHTGSLPELISIYHLFGDPALALR